MATVILFVIYIAFIGLGIPDSLFGTAWPAIYPEFQLPFSFAGIVTVIVSCGTITSSLFSARLIRRFGTAVVSAFSTLLTAAALIGYSLSGNLFVMCLLAIPLGLGAGSIDVALNNYVSLHYSATHMSFLHCFYGIGVSVSPYVLSRVMGGEAGWRGGYRIAFFIQIGISLLLFFTLPLWKRAHQETKTDSAAEARTLTLRQTLRVPGVKSMCALFIASCTIECTCGAWGSTYLVEYRHMAPEAAARLILLYYVGMATGRFLSGVLAARLDCRKIIRIGQGILGCALLVLLLPGSVAPAIGLFFIGLGNGPLFPNFNYLTPQNFGRDISRSVMGTQMAAAYAGVLATPPLCGLLGQAVGMWVFPYYLLLFFIIMMFITFRAGRLLFSEKK